MIDKDIEALNTLIDEIMTYAKLEQGTPSLDFAEITLFDVLDQVAVETEALKTQKEIELVAPPLYVKVDAERRYLHRVVQNLVGNAFAIAITKCELQVVFTATAWPLSVLKMMVPEFRNKIVKECLKPLPV